MSDLSRRLKKIPSPTLFLLSFVATIGVGTVALKTPLAVQTPVSWVDALFTATSAVCVTGLTVVDTGTTFTPLGQGILLALIQIGGLGLMTLTVFFFRMLGMSVSIQHRMIMQETFSAAPRRELLLLLKSIVMFTAVNELAGAVILTLYWWGEFPFGRALYLGVFHSVSAFCNAGFSLFADNLVSFRDSVVVNLTVASLIVLGGIGFPVVYDLYQFMQMRHRKRVKLSLQTRTVLTTTLILIVGGAVFFFWFERNQTLQSLPLSTAVLASVFQSITARTAGFNTLDLGQLGEPGALMMMVLMYIGASPGSCAGGIKTTTVSILFSALWSRLRGRWAIQLFHKNVTEEMMKKSLSILGLSIFFILLTFFAVLIFQQSIVLPQPGANDTFRVYLFEVLSAFGTVGLSMGATSVLSTGAKCSLIVIMLIGRVGVIGFSYVFIPKQTQVEVTYSEEPIMIG
ncbi:MAG: TrkH family potassium uptake protein [Thermodesulfobacteriota bacterium]